MLVCWEWLNQYVEISSAPDEMALRFAMSGLNHESTDHVGSDTVIDLEVTSNRGDCLGHIGVAREAAVLLGQELKLPAPALNEDKSARSADSIAIENRFLDGCPEYTARVIRGVKIGPSPDWLKRRLNSIGINSVNNVVDITNYVMMECGQPLHAFDLSKIRGNKIIVRQAQAGEQFEAIDHKTYQLDPNMVVIADAERPVALGGVMGGVDSEVAAGTTDLLIEAARFTPMSIRRTARKLKLHSPSSYRFERQTDPAGLDWASQRCCELILELAGGSLESGLVKAGEAAAERAAIAFRPSQLQRILGISIPVETSQSILTALGCLVDVSRPEQWTVTAPSWRNDLERECDLIEEIARIYGYELIPEDAVVPIGIATPRPKDTAMARARLVLSAYGIDEAMTPTVVPERQEQFGSLWCGQPPQQVDSPLLEGAKLLRRSIVPSLLASRYTNQTLSVKNAELYEVATIFKPLKGETALPSEQCTLGLVTAGNLQRIKGIAEHICTEIVGLRAPISTRDSAHTLLQDGTGQELLLDGATVGYFGLLSSDARKAFDLDADVGIAELNVDLLTSRLEPVRRADPVSAYPAVARDLNLIVDETILWSQLAEACADEGGEHLQNTVYLETYRDAKKDGAGKKRILLALHFQSLSKTLTGEEVDTAVKRIVDRCSADFKAKLLG